jgi:glycosyltransferase involved in cell wall biosynthesis
MKVLHVVPYVSSLYGGPPVVVAQMADTLSGLGCEVDVLTTTAYGNVELDLPTDQPVIHNGIRYFYCARQWPKFWMFSWYLRCWLYRNVRNYDLVHIHNLFTYTTLPSCAFARCFDIPYVITPHGMLDPWCLSHKWWKKRPYYHFLEHNNLQRASAIHVTSSFEARGMGSLGFNEKTHVIPLYVKSPALQERNCKDHNTLSLLFMSRLDPVKGLPTLLQALALLRERAGVAVVFTIAGHGRGEYLTELQTMVKKLNISENVKFVGFLQGEARAQVLAEADVFVLPSYHENFSLATAEAMAVGLPVIVSDQVGIAQEISEANAGVVVAINSPAAIADAVEKCANVGYRQVTGENGRRLVKQKFSQEQFGESLLQLYGNILTHPLGGRTSSKLTYGRRPS